MRTMWQSHWKNIPDHRQSKYFIKDPDPKYWKDIKHMSKNRMSNVIRFISGHGFMNRHHKTVIPTKQRHQDADADPRSKCRLCDLGPETPIHLTTVCPRLAWTRNQLFSQSQIVGYICDRPPPWSKGLLDFIQNDLIQTLDNSEDMLPRSSLGDRLANT